MTPEMVRTKLNTMAHTRSNTMAHTFELKTAGAALDEAQKALIMVHGRGGTAEDIMGLSQHLHVESYSIMAPQATNHTWYPHSFLAPVSRNEPWLGSAIEVMVKTVQVAMDAGILSENIYFFGFSQGACLTLEFLARNARRYGGAVALIGGVIGEQIETGNYCGDFLQTPVLLATSHPDFHVPVERVQATGSILNGMNAAVTTKVYENFGHTIHPGQLELANKVVFDAPQSE